VKNTGNQDFSYQSPRNVTPDRQRNTMQGHQSSSNVHNHVYGTQESIKQLYSSPKDSKRNMYATQDSIRRMYNSPKDSHLKKKNSYHHLCNFTTNKKKIKKKIKI
jgi:hypothetical protein